MAETSQPQEKADMKINPTRAQHLIENLTHVTGKIKAVAGDRPVRLVAVSKLKPVNDILALHQPPTSHFHFGENYTQELLQKAPLLPASIKWHFIGSLQTNKCLPLASQLPNLWCVESVDTAKKADQLDKGRAKLLSEKKDEITGEDKKILRVFVQVNTSGEESKSGVEPKDAVELCKHIVSLCPHLRLQGLMTIGAIARSKATSEDNPNEDFISLRQARDDVAEALKWPKENLELSMGMSEDFEGAVREGSSEVRVGSTIFGERPAKTDAKIIEQVS